MKPYGIPFSTWREDWSKGKATKCYRHHPGCKKVIMSEKYPFWFLNNLHSEEFTNSITCTAHPCPKRRKYGKCKDNVRSRSKSASVKKSIKRLWKRLGRIANKKAIVEGLSQCIE